MVKMRIVAWTALALGLLACGSEEDATSTGGTTSAQGGESASSSSGMGGMAASGTGGDAATSVGGTGGSPAGCTSLSDDFEDASSMSCWQRRHQVEGTFAQYEVIDIDQTVPGNLTITPTASGWYGEDAGVLVYKELTGDFVVEVDVLANNEQSPASAPVDPYHSAGLLVRDPASAPGAQNWLMYNVGYQDTFVGTEGKTTVNSVSVLTLSSGEHQGRLRICRVGTDYRMYHWYPGESAWTEDHVYPRTDLPATLQVGLIMNAWPPAAQGVARNVRGEFADITFGAVTATADCTAEITTPL